MERDRRLDGTTHRTRDTVQGRSSRVEERASPSGLDPNAADADFHPHAISERRRLVANRGGYCSAPRAQWHDVHNLCRSSTEGRQTVIYGRTDYQGDGEKDSACEAPDGPRPT